MNENRMRGRILATGALLALVVGACGGSSASAAPASAGAGGSPAGGGSPTAGGGTESQAPATAAAVSAQPTGNDPIAALTNLTSYKISFGMTSSGVTGGIAAMGDITMAGTIIVKPDPAADITMTLGGGIKMHIIEKDGKSWNDATGTMTLATDPGSTSLVDSLSPSKLLSGMGAYTSDMKTVGDEQKNGIATTHLQADDTTLTAAASALSMLGITNAKWTWDVWVAKDAGYAVSYAMKGTGDAGATLAITMDLTDVNSGANAVTAP